MMLFCRIINKECDLKKERENRLTEWRAKRQVLDKWMDEREEVQISGEIAPDLDTVRKQIKSMKVGDEKISARNNKLNYLHFFKRIDDFPIR